MTKTIAQKLAEREARPPGTILYSILVKGVVPLLSKGVKPTFTYKARPSEDKVPSCL